MKRLLPFLVFPALFGQPTQPVTVQPNCSIPINFNSTNTLQWDNRFTGCVNWILTYASRGFSALSIAVQSAPDAGGTPGTWVTFAGTIKSGINPNTNTAERATFFGTADPTDFQPWVRVNLSTVTGTGMVTGTLLGFNTTTGPGGSSPGSTIQKVDLEQVLGVTVLTGGQAGSQGVGGLAANGSAPVGNPVYIGGRDGSGNIFAPVFCTRSQSFDTSTSGNNLLVAAVAANVIRVCGWYLTPFTAGDTITTSLTQGTGATCAGGTTTLVGPFENVVTLTLEWFGGLATTAANALCLNLGSATRVTGNVSYAQFVP